MSEAGVWASGKARTKEIIKQKVEYACKHYKSRVQLEKDGKVLSQDVCAQSKQVEGL